MNLLSFFLINTVLAICTNSFTLTTSTIKSFMPKIEHSSPSLLFMGEKNNEDTTTNTSTSSDVNEIIAARIILSGDVNGGYYRSCVSNEAGRFRGLTGTMSPPDADSDEAEIYVEGKRFAVNGFVRWCKRGDVGLSQKVIMKSVSFNDVPLGVNDEFYVKVQ